MIRQRDILKTIDRFLGPGLVRLFPPVKTRPALDSLPPIRAILVIRPGGMGDAVLLFPLLKTLHHRCPAARIDVLAERRNAEVFDLSPNLISKVFCFDRIGELPEVLGHRYDVVIDTEQWYRLSAVAARLIRTDNRVGFATNSRRRLFNIPVAYDPQRHEVDNFLSLLSALTGEFFNWDPDRPFLSAQTGFSEGSNKKPIQRSLATVLIAPGAGYPEKQWGPDNFRRLSEWLVEKGYSTGLIGGPADISLAEEIAKGLPVRNYAGGTPLRETARLISTAALVIGGDTVALHLAAALGTPAIALFGPTPPAQWAPRGTRHRTLYHPPPCSPCSRFGHIPRCPYDVECLKRVTVEEVTAAIGEACPAPEPKPAGG